MDIRDLEAFTRDSYVAALSYILLWLATCDSDFSESERTIFCKLVPGLPGDQLEEILRLVNTANQEDLLRASRIVQEEVGSRNRFQLLNRFFFMAIADGRISLPENHALRFVSRLVYGSEKPMLRLYESMVGRSFPEAGDPSSRSWWLKKERGEDKRRSNQHGSRDEQASSWKHAPKMSRERAAVVLGIHGEITPQAVKPAYRKMVMTYHPDRFANQSKERIKEATIRFREIQEAYEALGP